LRGILDINTTYKGKVWKEMSDDEKREFLDIVDTEIKGKIMKLIMASAHLNKEERGFLRKRR